MTPLDIMNIILICLCIFLIVFIFAKLRAIKKDPAAIQRLS